MPEINGTDILIRVNTGTVGSPSYTTVGSQRGASISETDSPVDVSSKDSRNAKFLNGRYQSTLSLDALYVPGAADYAALKAAMRNGDPIFIRKRESGTDVEVADAVITDLSSDYPDQDAATVSASFQITGAWAAV